MSCLEVVFSETGGWTTSPRGLSSSSGYPKQRSRTRREGTRGHLCGVARGGGLSAERHSLWAALGGGGRSAWLPVERDPQLLEGRGANSSCALFPARRGYPRARRSPDKGRAFGPVPLVLKLHHSPSCREEVFSETPGFRCTSASFLSGEGHKYNIEMRICNEIAQQIIELGGRDDAMMVFLQPRAWEELQEENSPHLSAQATPPTILGLPIRVTTEALTEVQVTPRA